MPPRRSCVFALLASAACAVAAEPAPEKRPAPVLAVDHTPVAAAGPVVTYAEALAPARQAVVSVFSTKYARQRGGALGDPALRRFFGTTPLEQEPERGIGSGVIVSADGFLLTNHHVVDGADELLVRLPDDREFKARVVGSDPKTDVAVIKIEAEALPAITLADSDRLRVGDVVFALGNPLGVGQTATMGIVSATGRRGLGLLERPDGERGYEDFIQTDAAINMGNSGGALVDARGRLVGINTAIFTTNRGNIGIGFSIPVNLAVFAMRSIVEHGMVVRGYLGVSVQELDPGLAANFGLKDPRGVLVTAVTEGGPAAAAGLQAEDVVVAINDEPVANGDELRLRVSQIAPGTAVGIRVMRGGKPQVVTATVGKLEDPAAPAVPAAELVEGVEVARLDDSLRREFALSAEAAGVVVTRVDRRSPYASRFPTGVVIEEVNRRAVTDPRAAREALIKGRNLLRVRFRDAVRFVSLDLR